MPSDLESHWTVDERLFHLQERVAHVFGATKRLLEAKTITDQGDALNYLNDQVDQMITWHPDYDYETGLLRDDDDS